MSEFRMNNTQIELSAIDYLRLSFRKCALLQPLILDNEKTPSWDGNIIAYSQESSQSGFNKDYYHGTVPVQVKGTTTLPDLQTEQIKWPVRVVDLKNYLKSRGTVFFVIGLDQAGDHHKIFYAMLLPYEIFALMEGKETQGNISIPLQEYPEDDPAEITEMFFDFIRDSAKQASLCNKDSIPTLKEHDISSMIDHCSFTISSSKTDDWLHAIATSKRPTYIYAHTKVFDDTFPISIIPPGFKIASTSIDVPVSINGRKYYQSFSRGYKASEPFIILGKGITITFAKSEAEPGSINLTLKGTLSERILDLEFMIALAQHGQMNMQDHAMFAGLAPVHMQEQESLLTHLRLIQQTLIALGVSEDIDLDRWSDLEERNLRALIGSILYNSTVSMDSEDDITFGMMQLSNLQIMLISIRQEDGQMLIRSFFDSRMDVVKIAIDDEDMEKAFEAPLFILLTRQHLSQMDNFDGEKIIQAFEFIENPSKNLLGFSNTLLLEVLHAYDDHKKNVETLLTLAEKLCGWIQDHETNPDSHYAEINHLQIIRRQRALNIGEISRLTTLYESTDDPSVRCAVCILLGQYQEAENILASMNSEKRDVFCGFPIYRLVSGQAVVAV